MQTSDQWSPLHTFHSNNSELQSCKRATTGRHSEILINDSKLNHTKRATNCRPYYTTIHLYESVCKSHKPKHRLTKQLCISQKQQTQYYLLLWAVYIYISTITNHIFIHCQSYRCKSNRNQSQQPAYIILFHKTPLSYQQIHRICHIHKNHNHTARTINLFISKCKNISKQAYSNQHTTVNYHIKVSTYCTDCRRYS